MASKEDLNKLEEQVRLGLERAYAKMVEFKKQKNTPLVVSQDGQVVHIPADQIPPTTKAANPSKD